MIGYSTAGTLSRQGVMLGFAGATETEIHTSAGLLQQVLVAARDERLKEAGA